MKHEEKFYRRVFTAAETYVSHTTTQEYSVYCSTKNFYILAILFRRYHQFLQAQLHTAQEKKNPNSFPNLKLLFDIFKVPFRAIDK